MTPLAEILKRETDLVSRFISILGKEQEALQSGQADALDEINRGKLQLVEQLNQVGLERAEIAILPVPGGERAGMQAWLAQHPLEKQSALLWDALLNLAREAKEMHDLNGKLISIHLKQTGDALAVLMQRQQEHALYGSNGQSSQTTGSRIVDSA